LSLFSTKFKIPFIQTKNMANIINQSTFLIFSDFKILNKIVFSSFASIILIKNYLSSIINTSSKEKWNY